MEPTRQNPSSNNRDGGWREAVGAAGLALAIPWMLGIPIYIGIYLDRKYDTAPLWFIVWALLGLFTTAFDIYKLLKKFGQLK